MFMGLQLSSVLKDLHPRSKTLHWTEFLTQPAKISLQSQTTMSLCITVVSPPGDELHLSDCQHNHKDATIPL